MHKICAWCGNNIADSLDSCPGVSHGMCIECEALLIGDKPGSLRHFLDEIKSAQWRLHGMRLCPTPWRM